ncbi:MAG: hypothetical protein CL912_13580 [Deltaproteobacteria bacterium]|nr:hypothetical protein [Deltaproteobacteria bacterium]
MTSKPGEKSRRLIVQPATQGHDNDGSGLQEWVSETNAGTNFLAGLRCGLTFTAPLSHYFEAKRDSASVSGQDTDLWRGGKTGMTKPVESPASTTPSLRKDHQHAIERLLWMLSYASQCNCALAPQMSITL